MIHESCNGNEVFQRGLGERDTMADTRHQWSRVVITDKMMVPLNPDNGN